DPGAITLLLQNQVPGLQVEHDGEWVDVNPVHGGIIVNIGDFLQMRVLSFGRKTCLAHN
ncbi:1-aminocyclopropane-1-carboxylate oxidase-like protein, partial [Trifolium medium]|nr:1-aminocyclopropane-1-carboxylate oxidase-like protein [Trifolium medium]